MQSFRIQLQKNWQHLKNQRDGISAIKFEAAQIHFLSDVFDKKHRRTEHVFCRGWKSCIARATYRLVSYLLADN